MSRAKKIEEAARAYLDASRGMDVNSSTGAWMNYWARNREARAALKAALALPPDGDEYRRGVLRALSEVLDARDEAHQRGKIPPRASEWLDDVVDRIRSLSPAAPAEKSHTERCRECTHEFVLRCPACGARLHSGFSVEFHECSPAEPAEVIRTLRDRVQDPGFQAEVAALVASGSVKCRCGREANEHYARGEEDYCDGFIADLSQPAEPAKEDK